MEDNTANLDYVQATFFQEGNCMDGGDEEIIIEYKADLGLDNEKGGFFVIKTEQWSFNDIEEFEQMLQRIKQIMIKQ
jgi:hypothetical protein